MGAVHNEPGVTDPTELYRLRDGVYAADLLIVVVAELDLFTWLDRYEREHGGPAGAELVCRAHQLDPRAADVTITYLVARGLLARVGDGIMPTRAAREHLAAGSPYDLRAYYASLRERPTCRDLLAVLRTGRPAAWASAGGGKAWSDRLASPEFAASITAAMDARGPIWVRAWPRRSRTCPRAPFWISGVAPGSTAPRWWRDPPVCGPTSSNGHR